MARSSTTFDIFDAIRRGAASRHPGHADRGQETIRTIVNDLSISQAQVSKRLQVLSEVGLVGAPAEKHHSLYSLELARLQTFHDWLAKYEQAWSKNTWIGWTTTSKTYNDRRATMTTNRHRSAQIHGCPNELEEIVTTRAFDAPIELVLNVRPDKAGACAPLVRSVHRSSDGVLNRPARRRGVPHRLRDRRRRGVLGWGPTRKSATNRTSQRGSSKGGRMRGRTNGRTAQDRQSDDVDDATRVPDQAGRNHMTTHDGQEDSYDKWRRLLGSLLGRRETVSGWSRLEPTPHAAAITAIDAVRRPSLTPSAHGVRA